MNENTCVAVRDCRTYSDTVVVSYNDIQSECDTRQYSNHVVTYTVFFCYLPFLNQFVCKTIVRSLRLLRSCCLFVFVCVIGVVVQYSSYCVCRAQCVCYSLFRFFSLVDSFERFNKDKAAAAVVVLYCCSKTNKNKRRQEKKSSEKTEQMERK
jgi:hypothetical protein